MAIILVTGATGFVGRAVVREACRAGYEVRALVRDPSRAGWLAGRHGVELVAGDMLEASSVSNAMRGVTGAVHLVGIINEWGRNTFDRAHRQATVHVVDAARQEGVRRYVHMSALGTRPDAPSRYHQTKWAAEEHVRQSGLAWTIFRPSLIYGPGDISINVLAQTMRRAPVAPVLGTGHTRCQPVAVGEVARCFASIAGNRERFRAFIGGVDPRLTAAQPDRYRFELVLTLKTDRRSSRGRAKSPSMPSAGRCWTR